MLQPLKDLKQISLSLVNETTLLVPESMVLVAGTESSAATSIALAEGLGEFVSGLNEQLERAQAITNRAQRIAELARVLDKGITELIEKIQLVEEGPCWF